MCASTGVTVLPDPYLSAIIPPNDGTATDAISRDAGAGQAEIGVATWTNRKTEHAC